MYVVRPPLSAFVPHLGRIGRRRACVDVLLLYGLSEGGGVSHAGTSVFDAMDTDLPLLLLLTSCSREQR